MKFNIDNCGEKELQVYFLSRISYTIGIRKRLESMGDVLKTTDELNEKMVMETNLQVRRME